MASSSSEWQIVLRNPSGSVVLYNQLSNEVTALSPSELALTEDGDASWSHDSHDDDSEDAPTASSSTSLSPPADAMVCPLCKQRVAPIRRPELTSLTSRPKVKAVRTHADGRYFRLLSRTSTPQASRPSTPPPGSPTAAKASAAARAALGESPGKRKSAGHPLGDDKRIDGYYSRFFMEERKLGRGQRGSVFLCRHVLDDNYLGYYAVKKIPVGQSSPELLSVLQEVKYLERLHHENLTRYHHAWLENAQVSRFGPTVPTLFVLMDFANGGSLDSFVRARQGMTSGTTTPRTSGLDDDDERRRMRQKKLFRQRKQGSTDGTATPTIGSAAKAVHLLSLEEILSIFGDICRGLAFLHSKGILHRDLKSENVLLTWADEDTMIPSAALADFGSSIAMAENWQRQRSGRTGTLDWVPPESLAIDPKTGRFFEVTKKGDIWQLGLILHFLCFFRLPYAESDDIDRLQAEILAFRGFAIPDFTLRDKETPYHRLDLPLHLMEILSSMLTISPANRPSCDIVLEAIARIKAEPPAEVPHHALVPIVSRTPPIDKPPPLDTVSAEPLAVMPPTPQRVVLRSRIPPNQRIIAGLVVVKSFVATSLVSTGAPAAFGWLQILNVIEILVADPRLSIVLTALQAGLLLLTRYVGVGRQHL